MKKVVALGAVLLALSVANAAPVSYRTTHYQCEGKQRISVKHVNVDSNNFAVVTYKGRQYALAPAVSASGVRYVGLVGMTLNTGLEWVEWHGQGFLNSFPNNKPDSARSVLNNCKVLR